MKTFADGRPIHPLMERYWQRADSEGAGSEAEFFRLGASYFDEPEPALAILGPPAVTRLMCELWRTDPEIRSKFALANPLHRRDFALWLDREAGTLGLDEASVAAARSLLRRGTSLDRPPPRWPPQVPPRCGEAAEAWLAAPIAWDLGAAPGGIPMPRALTLLWELRQDVRLHFANRTRTDILDYIGWCLTQAIRDGCVAIELIERALAGFLDASEPEVDGGDDRPPATRLLRIMAPLYDGPHPDAARQFPHTRQGLICIAVWVCGVLRRRYGWPRSFIRRPSEWLSRIAPEAADAFLPLDNFAVGVRELRPDLQARCDLRTHEGRSALLDWLLSKGIEEYQLRERSQQSAHRVAQSPTKASLEPATTRELCLIGYAGLVSGRAEDLRMTALALGRHRRPWAVLDRLNREITTENGRRAAAFAKPPRVNLLHLNADTAFFDYLFLRECGIERGYTIGYWAWELAKFPDEWRSSFAFVQEVWAASRFAFEAVAPATTKPVLLMPPAVAIPAPEPGLQRADFGLPDDRFLFYFSFDFRSYVSRKNPLATVVAFRRAFPRSDTPVGLVLKTIGSDWKAEDRDALSEAIRGDPRICVNHQEFARPRAIALLALTDCFVSLHRSEGFGRGPAEAMLLGKPVIVTDYSGTRDFATPQTALPIGYSLVPVGEDEYPGAAGQVWAEPDIEEAAAAMRRIAGDSGLTKRLGRAGQARIRELYDPTVAGRRYLDRLAAIAKTA
ncbi:MAG: glycosyltransferase family 4 protein [Alphaproteobacteria bacterium]|nr:glycosyltransferase family 4 protein [Alphaproteobacteria bacterium]